MTYMCLYQQHFKNMEFYDVSYRKILSVCEMKNKRIKVTNNWRSLLSGVQIRRLHVIWNHKYDFRPTLHGTKFNYHFLHSFWNHTFFVNMIIRLFTSGNQGFHFDRLEKGCDLEQKIMRFANKFHCLEPIRLHTFPVISKWV